MRDLHELDKFRDVSLEVVEYYGSVGNDKTGAFLVPVPKGTGRLMRVLASNGDGWDHVSVSLRHRCPVWEEMEYVKRLFFLPTETAMQLHVPVAEHINRSPNVLHLWRPHEGTIPLPPSIFV